MLGDVLAGAAISFLIATVTTPVGVSGAVFLIPVQISLLHTPSPALTPTNLLYNLIAIPGALLRFHREGRMVGPLTRLLVLGTLPGVVAGAVIRVEFLAGPRQFLVVVALVLLPIGAWLATQRHHGPPRAVEHQPRLGTARVFALALIVGVIGGICGIGGGSILAPILLLGGFAVADVAGAALAATFLTSVVGVVTYQLLQRRHGGDAAIAPEWTLGILMGLGGLVGSYAGARLQGRIPEAVIRRSRGVVVLLVGLRYLLEGAGVA
jgi:uncharacterized protein